jgi:hypothetical protein
MPKSLRRESQYLQAFLNIEKKRTAGGFRRSVSLWDDRA